MLVSTADVRSWLNLPEGDKNPNDNLQTLILSTQSFVESWTNRQLEGTHYNAHPDYCYLDGTGQRWLYLPQSPVSWIGTVYVDHDREFDAATAIGSADLVIYWAEGKIYSEEMPFTKGHRNIKVEYKAGYGPTATSSYPLPYDLKQLMIEMTVQAYKEGITAVHTVEAGENTRLMQMLANNSSWKATLSEYKNYAAGLSGYWE